MRRKVKVRSYKKRGGIVVHRHERSLNHAGSSEPRTYYVFPVTVHAGGRQTMGGGQKVALSAGIYPHEVLKDAGIAVISWDYTDRSGRWIYVHDYDFADAMRALRGMSSATFEASDNHARGRVRPRESYLPEDLRGLPPFTPEGTDLALWVWDKSYPQSDGSVKTLYSGVAFAGKSNDPLWYLIFRSDAERMRKIQASIAARKEVLGYKAKEKAERAALAHTVKVGDIFETNWGYDQTNVNFYEVVEVRGKQIVAREIAGRISDRSGDADYVVPVPGQFVGAPFRALVTSSGFRADGHLATKWDGKPAYATGAYAGH